MSERGPDEHGGRRWNASFGIKWGEVIGNYDCPLMQRWVIETPIGSLRLHHFMHSDDGRALHDHPWWFVTFPLGKGYMDATPCPACDGTGAYGFHEIQGSAPCLARCDRGRVRTFVPPWRFSYRPALHRHAVDTDGVWTIIITGRKCREWGFWSVKREFFESRRYFKRFGHAPCED